MKMQQQQQAATIHEIRQVAYVQWMSQRPYDRIVRLQQVPTPKPHMKVTGHGNRRLKERVR